MMHAPAIKICGIATPDSLEAAIAAQADFAGFVFHPRSPRHVDLTKAAELGAQASERIRRVGLFVDTPGKEIAKAANAAGLDVIQLHGSETIGQIASLKAELGLPVWKVVSVATATDLERAVRFAGLADLVLLDARTPEGTLPGGMGLTFDWGLLTTWQAPCAWGLAGGLTPANVTVAVQRTGAKLVDTSSGVESAPGVKDAKLITAFCAAARSA